MTVMDVMEGKKAEFSIPQDNFIIAAVLMYPGRYVIDSVRNTTDPIVAATTDRLHNIAGTYIGKDDPAAIVQAAEEISPLRKSMLCIQDAHTTWPETQGEATTCRSCRSRQGTAASSNFCIPIVSCTLFSMHEGKFTAHADAFDTPGLGLFRNKAVIKAEYMREQGFVHPATLIPEELEYNKGYQAMMAEAKKKFK